MRVGRRIIPLKISCYVRQQAVVLLTDKWITHLRGEICLSFTHLVTHPPLSFAIVSLTLPLIFWIACRLHDSLYILLSNKYMLLSLLLIAFCLSTAFIRLIVQSSLHLCFRIGGRSLIRYVVFPWIRVIGRTGVFKNSTAISLPVYFVSGIW